MQWLLLAPDAASPVPMQSETSTPPQSLLVVDNSVHPQLPQQLRLVSTTTCCNHVTACQLGKLLCGCVRGSVGSRTR